MGGRASAGLVLPAGYTDVDVGTFAANTSAQYDDQAGSAGRRSDLALLNRSTNRVGDAWHIALDGAEPLARHHDQLHGGGRHHGGRPLPALRVQRHLAEEVTRAEIGYALLPAHYLCRALLDHKELEACLALGHETLARRNVDLVREPCEPGPLPLLERREERNLLELGLVHWDPFQTGEYQPDRTLDYPEESRPARPAESALAERTPLGQPGRDYSRAGTRVHEIRPDRRKGGRVR